jgi:hypothetical protein
MAHQYSVEIHDYISNRLESAQSALKDAQTSGSDLSVKNAEGRIHALMQLRTMMTEKFDLMNRRYFKH